jgi:hypothetical protein
MIANNKPVQPAAKAHMMLKPALTWSCHKAIAPTKMNGLTHELSRPADRVRLE